MKIGIAARWDPLDKQSWSGVPYYTQREIAKTNEVGLYYYKWTWGLREWLTMQKSINRRLFKKQTAVEYLQAYAKYFSKKLERDLEARPVDLLFVVASPQLISDIKTDIPIIYMTDASFLQLQGYYPFFSNLAAYNIRQGIAVDKKAFQNASHCMVTSDWCKESAVRDYGIAPEKISVAPMGANIDVDRIMKPDLVEQCRLLFLGVEWERKGGDIVLETFYLLREKGLEPRLHIVGCVPPPVAATDDAITVIPFLDKNNPVEMRQLEDIFYHTDLLILPTRAECAGIVFSEAAAFGVPSITTSTGGIPTCVKDGINGYALPLSAGATDYAERIASLLADRGKLAQLKQSSRRWYETNLSWEAWGKRFNEIAKALIQESSLRK